MNWAAEEFKDLDLGDKRLNKRTVRLVERFAASPVDNSKNTDAVRALVGRVMEQLSPEARLVITLLEIEDRSVKEIAQLTGWSVPLVKVRAFRARAQMKKILETLTQEKYL